MKYEKNEMVQRDHNYCIVDEVDSILIDESRTPFLFLEKSRIKQLSILPLMILLNIYKKLILN